MSITAPSPVRRRLALVAAAALAIPVAGCGASSGSSSGANDPASAIPASASFYLEASVQPTGRQRSDLEAAGRKILGTSDPAAKLRELINQAAAKKGKSYDKDIAPWLGEKAAIGITGYSAGKSQFAVVVNSTNDDKANTLVDGDSSYTTKRSYQGTDYRYDPSDATAAGVVKHFLVIGSEPAFKQVVDVLEKGATALSSNVDLQDARKKVGDNPGFVFVDLQGLFRSIAGTAGSSLNPSELSSVNGIFKRFRAVGIGIGADAQAIRMHVATIGSGATTGNGPGSALPLANAPGDAWIAIAQSKVGDSFMHGLDSLKNSDGSSLGDTLSQLQTATGLDVKNDLLSWMGDAALFVEGDSVPALGGALVVESKDPAKTRLAITKIKGLLAQFNQRPGAVPQGMSAGFTLPAGTARKAYIGLAGSRFVIAVGAKALRDAIHPSSTLASSPDFKSASGLLGSSVKPSFYLDFQTLTRFIALAAHNSASFAQAKPYLDAFTAIIGGGESGGKAEVAVGLK